MSSSRLLLVIDMQNDFIDGALGTAEATAIVPKVAEKIAAYRNHGYSVIFTRDTHYDNYMTTQEGKNLPVPHCIKGTAGWNLSPVLAVSDSEVIDKPSFGSLALAQRVLDLNNTAGGFERIELIGLCTDICVISNAMILKAQLPEVEIQVDSSCCAGVTPESHLNALSAMKMCQISVI
ncbi:MAG: cysteine hydrolase [Ruminococcaceae bacterium]|nr:cysteine hydrolase [Oscillospiraceae bacterium]